SAWEHLVDEADGHEGGAEAVYEGRREPNEELNRRVPERGGTRIARDEAGQHEYGREADEEQRRAAAPDARGVAVARQTVENSYQRRPVGGRWPQGGNHSHQTKPGAKIGDPLERPVGAECLGAEAGELCGSVIDLRRTDHKACDPQGDHNERGYGDEPVERECSRVEEEVFGAGGRHGGGGRGE